MQHLWNIYHHEIPIFIQEFSQTSPMLRLQDIGMNCGCEYTQFPIFKDCQPYSRYDHSIGVALIIWHFTHSQKQTIAGLLHDIATPVFAHTVDFLNGDHEKQESTEANTEDIIAQSCELITLLKKYNMSLSEVANYHLYPIADNESPMLCADRLEYSLGNMLNYGFATLAEIQMFYHDLTTDFNEQKKPEIIFQTPDIAIAFTQKALKNSYVYVSNADRFAMQALANLLKNAIENQILTLEDLYQNERYVIEKLCAHSSTNQQWQHYTHYSHITNTHHPFLENALQISAKKRYIDPFVMNMGRVSYISCEIQKQIQTFCHMTFDDYLLAE